MYFILCTGQKACFSIGYKNLEEEHLARSLSSINNNDKTAKPMAISQIQLQQRINPDYGAECKVVVTTTFPHCCMIKTKRYQEAGDSAALHTLVSCKEQFDTTQKSLHHDKFYRSIPERSQNFPNNAT